MFDKLAATEAKYDQLMAEMANPSVQSDTATFRSHSKELAQEELAALAAQRDVLLSEIKVLLVPKDPNDEKNVVLEIRAGTGGDEAALFAAELFRMYNKFAERQRWRVEVMSSSDTGVGGLKEVIA